MAGEPKQAMEHSVYIRKHVASWLRHVLGDSFVRKWIVKPLPKASYVDDMSKDDHKHRTMFFLLAYTGIAMLAVLLLEAIRLCMNRHIQRLRPSRTEAAEKAGGFCDNCCGQKGRNYVPVQSRDKDAPLMQESPEEEEDLEAHGEAEELSSQLIPERDSNVDEEEAEATRKRVSGYDPQDLLFVAYQHTYTFSCLALATYAFLNDYLSEDFGLDYELYLPWLCGTVLMHLCCLFYTFALARRRKRTLPLQITAIPKTTLDPSGGHLGALKDAVAAGIYAQHSFQKNLWGPIFLSGITAICMFLPNLWIYHDLHPFRDFQESLWPIVLAVDRQPTEQQQAEQAVRQRACTDTPLESVKKFVLQQLDAQTREHKQATAILGDMPQAVTGFCFLWFYVHGKQSNFIVLVTFLAVVKSFLILVFRPHILCALATLGLPWSHLTETDVNRAIGCKSVCTWTCRSKAVRGILRDEQTPPRVRVAAIHALLKLHQANWQREAKEGSGSEELTAQELDSIEQTVLWEVATQTDKQTQIAAQRVMQSIAHDSLWRKTSAQLRRLRSDDHDETVQAARALATEYPQYAGAYVRDLVTLLKRGHMSHASHELLRRGSFPVESEAKGGVEAQTLCGGLFQSTTSSPSKEDGKALAELWASSLAPTLTGDLGAADARAKAFRQTRDVREAASMALGTLGMNLQEGGKAKKKLSEEVRAKMAAAVQKVAPDIVKLLRSDNREVRSAALSAVVQFRGAPAVSAVEEAMKLLEHAGYHDKRKVGEIALVHLLPHMASEVQRPLIAKLLVLMRESEKSPRKAVAYRVLGRLGGSSAGVALEELNKQPDSPSREFQELKTVLVCQKKAVEAVGGDAALAEGINLLLDRREGEVGQAKRLLSQIRSGKEVFQVLAKEGLARKASADSDNCGGVLPVFFTDLEPDDTMFIAEMWKYLREGSGCCRPLVIFAADLEGKDAGEIFEKKLLLAALILGQVDFHILTPEPGNVPDKVGSAPHPLARSMAKLRDRNLEAISQRISGFSCQAIRFYICAPGRGNLGTLVESLGARVYTPGTSKQNQELAICKRHVSLYSGQFNIKGMTETDINALNLLVGDNEVLTDCGKFPFFGGAAAHPLTGGFGTFALPSFAPLLSSRHPLVAAVWGLFNDEFNMQLIAPQKLFAEALVGVDARGDCKELYNQGKIKQYAQFICTDEHLFQKVMPKKRLTLRSFACEGVDAPLCDQLLFLNEWVKANQPKAPAQFADLKEAAATWVVEEKGVWNLNRVHQYTSVDTREGMPGLKAQQPLMRHSHDAEALYMMSEALQDYVLNHMSELAEPMAEADVKECQLFS